MARGGDDAVKRTEVNVELLPDQVSALDGWRRQQTETMSRAQAIGVLMAKALTSPGAH
jgi:hypothetical protein